MVQGIKFETIPDYNVNKTFHTRENKIIISHYKWYKFNEKQMEDKYSKKFSSLL